MHDKKNLLWHHEKNQVNHEPRRTPMSTVTQVEAAVKTIFGRAEALGRHTGFVQRVRQGKFTGRSFAATLVLGLLQPGEVSLSTLAHFATHLGVQVSPQAIDERCGEGAAHFLQQLLNVAFTQVVAADPVAIPLLRRFREVIVEDSSTFTLPPQLRGEWEGCGGSGSPAAFKVQVRQDLLTGGFTGLAMQSGRTPDSRSTLKEQRRGTRSVRIADLGYFDTAQFQRETETGEYFLSRYKAGNVQLFSVEGERIDLLALLREHAGQASSQCAVLVSATRRVPARLLAIPVPEEVAVKRQAAAIRKAQKHSRQANPQLLELSHWTLLLTNIPAEELSIEEAVVLYRLRWQIELLFKLWKHFQQAATSRSQHPWHILCDIYAKLLGCLLVHWVMIVGCWQIPSRSMVKAAHAIRTQAVLIAKALGGKLTLRWVLREIMQGLAGCRMTSRKTAPHAYQLMQPEPPPSSEAAQALSTIVLT